jgi:transcriptional regulator with XRE-family HTH domain
VTPLAQYFADELRRAREAANMTQEQLAQTINFSKSTVAMVETCQRSPKEDFTTAVDKALDTDGRFSRMRERLLRAEITPAWFRPWTEYEREAAEIRWYEPLLVPGLLQVTDYASAVLLRVDDPERTESLVAARLERQQVVGRTSVTVIIEESVLRRQVGAREAMHRQLHHLASVAEVAVHVLPTAAETNRHLDGSFALAVVDGTEVAYVDTPARGFVLEDREVVWQLRQRWEVLAAEALPRKLSRELILKEAESWKINST